MAKKRDRQIGTERSDTYISDEQAKECREELARRAANRPAIIARERELESPIIQELAGIGVKVSRIDDFDPSDQSLQRIFNIPSRVVPPVTAEVAKILLKWLPRLREIDLDDMIQRAIIQALRQAREPYDGRPLVDLFIGPQGKWGGFRERISELFYVTQPTGIANWLIDVVGNRKYDIDCGFLVVTLARQIPRATSIPIVRKELDYVPAAVAIALGEIGDAPEADLLESFLKEPHDWDSKDTERWVCKKVEQAIRKIRRRAEREARLAAKPKSKRGTWKT